MAKLPLVCFLSFLCISCLASAAPQADFNILTLTWAGAHCNNFFTKCCSPTAGMPAQDFFVQALETYDSASGKPVTNCNSTCRFLVNPLEKLIFDLNRYWPDVSCPSNNGKQQWESMWCRYGLCSSFSRNETAYFARALQLRARVDPLFVLEEYDIVPSNSQTYSLEDIENALTPSLGFSFSIECNRYLDHHVWGFGSSQLYKIHVCVSADGKRLITCPIPMTSNCDANVRFLPFPSNLLPDVTVNPSRMPARGNAAM